MADLTKQGSVYVTISFQSPNTVLGSSSAIWVMLKTRYNMYILLICQLAFMWRAPVCPACVTKLFSSSSQVITSYFPMERRMLIITQACT
jgi:hypothetical protein